jgi:hypothetical protein
VGGGEDGVSGRWGQRAHRAKRHGGIRNGRARRSRAAYRARVYRQDMLEQERRLWRRVRLGEHGDKEEEDRQANPRRAIARARGQKRPHARWLRKALQHEQRVLGARADRAVARRERLRERWHEHVADGRVRALVGDEGEQLADCAKRLQAHLQRAEPGADRGEAERRGREGRCA